MQPFDEPNQDRLLAYIAGTLSPDEMRAIEHILAESPALQDEVASWTRLIEDLTSLGERITASTPPIDIADAVMARIRQADTPMSIDGDDASCPTLDHWVDVLLDGADAPEHFDTPAWLGALVDDFEELRTVRARGVPSVDIADAVMQEIAGPSIASDATTTAGSSIRRGRNYGWYGLAAAASIAVVAAGIHFLFVTGGRPNEFQLAEGVHPRRPGMETVVPQTPPFHDTEPVAPDHGFETSPPALDDPEHSYEAVDDPDMRAITAQEVIETRQLAAQADQGARNQLNEWARLSDEQAREVAENAEVSAGAIVAAVGALPSSEREHYLVRAVQHMPQHPGARLALTQTYYVQPERLEMAFDQIEMLRELDEENALPYYLEAKLRLDAGDLEGALALLEQAAQFEMATAYGLDNAQFQEEALVAAGLTQEAARLLSALTAGHEEYDFLYELGRDLLDYGTMFADADNLLAAEQIFESVMRLGDQLNEGAAFLPELMAAFDIERTAIEMLGDVYTALGAAQALEALAEQAIQLMHNFDALNGFMASLEHVFAVENEAGFWGALADTVRQVGNVPLFESFLSGNTDIVQMLETISTGQGTR